MSQTINFEDSLLPSLGKTAKYLGYYFMDSFLENGIDLSKEQWLVLKKLSEYDGQIQNDLAIITNRSKTSLTRLIHTMEKKGLVNRIASKKDKRINHVYLSELGKQNYLKSLPVIKKINNELMENISKEDIEKTIQILNDVQKNTNKKLKLD